MKNISEEEFDRLAFLARLEFNDTEKKTLMNDLEEIIGFCEQLNEVNTKDYAPLIYMSPTVNRVRPDQVGAMLSQKEALLNAPAADSDFFRVPKVMKPKK